jgi:E3 ubiquitin-protein ligase TRIP12
MDRAIPVGNKICSRRIQQREQDLHRDRIKNMKSQVDTRTPRVATLEHVKVNLKKEQMMEDRYTEIDRDNRILLKKMTDIMKQQNTPSVTPRGPVSGGPVSLNKDARKKELLRITRENQTILKRIQQAQPVYNHVEWEDEHRKNCNYLKNRCEFPVMLRTPRQGTSELVSMVEDDGAMTARSAQSSSAAQQDLTDGANQRYVLKEGMKLSDTYYLVDMSTDGRNLYVSAFDSNSSVTLEVEVKEKTHRKLYREANGDYRRIAQRLKVSSQGRLLLDGVEEESHDVMDELDASSMVARSTT